MSKSNIVKPSYVTKLPSDITNDDVIAFIEDYKDWLTKDKRNVSYSSFCREKGIKNPYNFKDYLMKNFSGLNNTIDFQALWAEVEKVREDKLIELGIFDKDVNANFLINLMKSRFGWHDNTVVVGISMSDIIEAKKQALQAQDAEVVNEE